MRVIKLTNTSKRTHKILSDWYNSNRQKTHMVEYNGMKPNHIHGTLEFSIESDKSKMVIVYGNPKLIDVYVYLNDKNKTMYDDHYTCLIKNINTSKRLINTISKI